MSSSKKKILFIDDSVSMHTLVSAHIEKAGYTCISAKDGAEGLNMVQEVKPDLILLDYIMPGLDGGQVYAELTTNPTYRDVSQTPVIFLTAKDLDPSDKTKFLKGGASAYLQKPFGMRELINVIENVFIINDINNKNVQLQTEIKQTRDYLESLIDTIPIGILSVDKNGEIKKINSHLSKIMKLEQSSDLIGRNLLEQNLFQSPEFRQQIETTLQNGLSTSIDSLKYLTSQNDKISLRLKTVPIFEGEAISGEIIIAQDITEAEQKENELSMLGQISHFMNRTLDLDQLLHLILTALTAGNAFGFSRAMILLINESDQTLDGKMGVGPTVAEEAYQIWQELSREQMSLPNFLQKYGMRQAPTDAHFTSLVKQIKIPLENFDCIINRVISDQVPLKVERARTNLDSCTSIFATLNFDEFLVVPLLARDKTIGVVIADNKFSNRQLDERMLNLMAIFASQAGVAVERAEAYSELELEKNKLEKAYGELKETQQRLLHSERLAAIGKMAAHVAHEIRNPLVTIGGFANNIKKITSENNQDKRLMNFAQIITEEVKRLENVLSKILEFSKLAKPAVVSGDINKAIEGVIAFLEMREEIKLKNININYQPDHTIPLTLFDPEQIKQVLLNLFQNAIYSMPDGGDLSISTRKRDEKNLEILVSDTGVGIPENVMDEMFTPFFTTKKHGTGLGLPISLKIINSHGGNIEVDSQVDKGTTFTICLPIVDDIQTFHNLVETVR
ncbi:response regulator [candidate division KSB1 bacterium]|nr:response regulator [candidate division KSB1 bacterium]